MSQLELFAERASARSTTNFVTNMKLPVHRWYRYSAGYSAQWAERVILAELGESGRVLDPFVGSGTTMLAAQAVGSKSVGVESQPFVAAVARSKLNWSTSIRAFREANRAVLSYARARPVSISGFGSEPPLLQKCYSAENLGSLRLLQAAIRESEAEESVRGLLWLALMAILRPASHVGTAQWQYVLPNKSKARVINPIDGFGVQCETMAADMAHLQSTIANSPMAMLVEDDIRSMSTELPACDFVLTSPPYANNYDYADATRLEMTFLGDVSSWADLRPIRDVLVHSCTQHMSGYDGEAALESEHLDCIRRELQAAYWQLDNVRQDKGGRKAYHLMVVGYFLSMAYAMKTIRKSLVSDGKACFVVGDSAPYGVHIPVEKWLGCLALAAGFNSYSFEKIRDRNTKWKNRKHRVPLHEGHLWVD